MKENKVTLSFQTEATFYSNGSELSNHLILLLHGYAESGKIILEKLSPYLPKNAYIAAPNGPFPFVIKNKQTRKPDLGYSWYFYNPETDEYVIDMKSALSYLESHLLNITSTAIDKITVIGYSQGGYIAPFVASKNSKVDHVIGLSCRFTHEELSGPLHFKLDGIHGTLDDVIDPSGSLISHLKLQPMVDGGDFYSVDGSSHILDDNILSKLRSLV